MKYFFKFVDWFCLTIFFIYAIKGFAGSKDITPVVGGLGYLMAALHVLFHHILFPAMTNKNKKNS